ncbi:MAG: response regulator, partial [Candidatus Electrothrix sp. MAN1_4]|nr:response regulator [Candidatus Electrothrix sp. MAN1_4]
MSDTEHIQPPVSLDTNNSLEDGEIILVVDDYEMIVTLIQDFLQQQGVEVQSANSMETTRNILQEKRIALVLLDINLPDGSGTDLIAEIKQANPTTAIIMLSAATDLQTALKCLRHGADDYLTKPVQLGTFWETVRKVLEKRRLQIKHQP